MMALRILLVQVCQHEEDAIAADASHRREEGATVAAAEQSTRRGHLHITQGTIRHREGGASIVADAKRTLA
jgi:hypothetical protein